MKEQKEEIIIVDKAEDLKRILRQKDFQEYEKRIDLLTSSTNRLFDETFKNDLKPGQLKNLQIQIGEAIGYLEHAEHSDQIQFLTEPELKDKIAEKLARSIESLRTAAKKVQSKIEKAGGKIVQPGIHITTKLDKKKWEPIARILAKHLQTPEGGEYRPNDIFSILQGGGKISIKSSQRPELIHNLDEILGKPETFNLEKESIAQIIVGTFTTEDKPLSYSGIKSALSREPKKTPETWN